MTSPDRKTIPVGKKLRNLFRVARYVFAIGIITVLVRQYRSKIDSNILEVIKENLQMWEFLCALSFSLFLPIVCSLKWQMILRKPYGKVPLFPLVASRFAAQSLNVILPAKGGEVVKLILLKKYISSGVCIGSMLFERLIDFCTLGVIATVCLYSFGYINGLLFGCALCPLILLLLIVPGSRVFFWLLKRVGIDLTMPVPGSGRPGWRKVLEDLREFVFKIRDDWAVLIFYLFLTLVQWGLTVVQSWFIFYALGATVSFLEAMKVAVGILISLLPVSVGGLGTREAVFYYLYSDAVSAEVVLLFSVLFFLIRYIIPGLFGLLVILTIKGSEEGENSI